LFVLYIFATYLLNKDVYITRQLHHPSLCIKQYFIIYIGHNACKRTDVLNIEQLLQTTGKITTQFYVEPFSPNSSICLGLPMILMHTSMYDELECGPMPNLMVALPNIGGALCSTPQSLADAHY